MTDVGETAPVVRRLVASVVDAVVLLGPVLAAWLAVPRASGLRVPVVLLVGGSVATVQLITRSRRGWTLGQLLTGVRVVGQHDGRPIGVRRTVLRTLVVAAGGLVVGVGALVVLVSPLLDRSGRRVGWHDGAVSARVVRAGGLPSAPSVTPGGSVRPAAAVVAPPGPGAAPVLAYGLMPELERTRRADPRDDVGWDDGETYRPMSATVELSDGHHYVVQGVVLVGRNPIAEVGQTGLRLTDPDRSVSRTHLRLTVGPIAVWAEDLASTNGSVVHLPDDSVDACPPGHPVQVPVGSRIALGDSWLRLLAVSGEPPFPDVTTRR